MKIHQVIFLGSTDGLLFNKNAGLSAIRGERMDTMQVWICEIYKGLERLESAIFYGTYEDADTQTVARMTMVGGTSYIIF